MPPKNAGGKKGKGGGDDDDGAPKGTCNQIKVMLAEGSSSQLQLARADPSRCPAPGPPHPLREAQQGEQPSRHGRPPPSRAR